MNDVLGSPDIQAPDPQLPDPGKPDNGPDPEPTPKGDKSDGTDNREPAANDAKGGAAEASEATPETETVGSGGTAKATAGPGQGGDRDRARRQAKSAIFGDYVEGDKFVLGLDGERVRLFRLGPSHYEQADKAFVEPEGWFELQHDLRDERIVILSGRPGDGRSTLATRLFIAAGVQTIYHLDARVDLRKLAEQIAGAPGNGDHPADEGDGYLLATPADLTGLGALEDALDRSRARIILTVDTGADLGSDAHSRYLREMPPRPAAVEVLTCHARYWFEQEDLADAVLDQEQVRQYLELAVPRMRSCEDAASLALLLFQETRDGQTDLDSVRRRHLRRNTDQFTMWFAGLDDIETRSLAVALAVLNEQPYEDVVGAAEALYERLATTTTIHVDIDGTLRQERVDRMRAPTSSRLRRLGASTVRAIVDRPTGRAPATIMKYDDPDVVAKVLEHVWSDYRIQPILLDWLDELVMADDIDIRMRASTAVGRWAAGAYAHLLPALLRGWARAPEGQRREAAAVAMSAAASREPRLRPAIDATVTGWYVSTSRLEQATAVRAFGVGVGHADLADTLTALGRLARTTDNLAVAVAMGFALADLLIEDLGRAPRIFQALREWCADPRRRVIGEFCFLIVANEVITIVDDPAAAAPTRHPTMLDLARDHEELHDPLFSLWAQALGPTWHDNATAVLTNWARQVHRDPRLLEIFARVVRAIVWRAPRTRPDFKHLAEEWVDEDNLRPLPRAADAVNAALV